MKKILILIFLLFLTACSSSSINKITAEEGKAMLDGNEEIILLDVRTYSEYAEGHIEDALLLPLSDLETEADEIIPDKNAIYIIYCRSGNRSDQAANILVDLGYQNIYDMGGIIDWPYEIIK
jgi:phage shock protein E